MKPSAPLARPAWTLVPWVAILAWLGGAAAALAQREPVLKQIDHPHNYYFREMYLPQLTSGPSAAAWSPDGSELVFSMKGSLWRQKVGSTSARQLTDGPGYDYQPDWSPDGRYVAYAKYQADALELHVLDLESGRSWPITSGGAVNLEPHWSPDGSRLAYVSTAHKGHFHLFVATMKDGRAVASERLTGETFTEAKRYYYSAVDHEISPTWSPNGKELLFVHNHGRVYGTGGLWRMAAEPGAAPRPVLYEETTWKARPHWAPDGRRVVYSSYDRRQWHQLWLTTADGGDPLALTYGEHDETAPRWSPDGSRIAFVSNRGGNTELWLVEAVGGRQTRLEQRELRYLNPTARLRLTLLDPAGRPTDARVSVRAEDGRFFAPDGAWMHADDSFVRAEMSDEPRYFHARGALEVTLPAGRLRILVMNGFAHAVETREIAAAAGGTASLTVRLKALPPLPGPGRWMSGDLHVHMNYAGTYRSTPETMLAQARAEDLNLVANLIVNKEQRIPDIGYFSARPDPASTPNQVLLHGQEFHTSYWGHVGLLGLTRHYLLPDYAAYPGTAAASPYPPNTVVADLVHEQGGLMGYVHPYDIEDMPDPSAARNHALPVDVALGKVDYLEVLGFSDHRSTASVWYRLLNLGFRLPAGAGTDAMANYASLRGPVGTNRTYVSLPAGPIRPDAYMQELRAGRTFASNAPLLHFTLGGKGVGGTLALAAGAHEVPFTASLRSIVPIGHLEIVCNGAVAADLSSRVVDRVADARGTLPLSRGGWCVLRAFGDGPTYPVLDVYPYGTTSPVYVEVAGAPLEAPEDAAYFVAWLDHVVARVKDHPDFNTAREREYVLDSLARARAVYESKREGATARRSR